MTSNKNIKLWFTDFWHPETEEAICQQNPIYKLLAKHWNLILTPDPDFMIYSSFGCEYLKYKCMRIYYTGENMRPNFSMCDYAFSFDYPVNERNYRLPFYRFNPEYDKIKACRTLPANFEKRKFCCFLVSNNRAKERIEMFNLLSQYKKVDSGGKVFNNIGYCVGTSQEDKYAWMHNYKFSIVFENSEYPGYTTEKLFDGLMTDTIPIYWGNPLIGQEFNTKAFINCYDYPHFPAVVEAVKKIDQDPTLQIEYLRQPYLPNGQETEACKEENIIAKFAEIFEHGKIFVPVATKRKQIIYYPVKMGKRYSLKTVRAIRKFPRRVGGKIKKVFKHLFHLDRT